MAPAEDWIIAHTSPFGAMGSGCQKLVYIFLSIRLDVTEMQCDIDNIVIFGPKYEFCIPESIRIGNSYSLFPL